MNPVVVSGAYDNLQSRDLRFLQEASRIGPVTVLLWSDTVAQRLLGHPTKFPYPERDYFLAHLRQVERVIEVPDLDDADTLPSVCPAGAGTWAVLQPGGGPKQLALAGSRELTLHSITPADLAGFPVAQPALPALGSRPRVVVTGCYDWLHSGHVRFFEEVSALGDLYVIVGHDANIRLLKGEGHPLLSQEERRYLVSCVRGVTGTLISSGQGWLDAEPEIRQLQPQIYAVNEDGDQGGKREFCRQNGIEYRVLRRTPAPGLPSRSSTNLRGF